MEILMAILAFIGIFFAGATWWNHRRANLERKEKERILKEQKEKEENYYKTLTSVTNTVKKDVKEILESELCNVVRQDQISATNQKIIQTIDTKIEEINNKIDDISYKVIETDKKNIKNNIIEFAEDLRNGLVRSKMAYKNILAQYDYYKGELHGNSYIDEEIEYIKSEMKNL